MKINTHALAAAAISLVGLFVANWGTIAPIVANNKFLSAIGGAVVAAYLTYHKPNTGSK